MEYEIRRIYRLYFSGHNIITAEKCLGDAYLVRISNDRARVQKLIILAPRKTEAKDYDI